MRSSCPGETCADARPSRCTATCKQDASQWYTHMSNIAAACSVDGPQSAWCQAGVLYLCVPALPTCQVVCLGLGANGEVSSTMGGQGWPAARHVRSPPGYVDK
jgi:hypothetical protein